MKQKSFTNITLIVLVVVIALIVGCSSVDNEAHQQTLQSTPNPTQPSPAPAKNETVSTYHDVKYFYDTTQYPKSGEPIGTRHKERVSIRGKLTATEIYPECLIAPCPQPNPPDYQYALEDISNSTYFIYILRTDKAIFIKSLVVGKTYIMTGTLEHNFNYMQQPNFDFDAESVELY